MECFLESISCALSLSASSRCLISVIAFGFLVMFGFGFLVMFCIIIFIQ